MDEGAGGRATTHATGPALRERETQPPHCKRRHGVRARDGAATSTCGLAPALGWRCQAGWAHPEGQCAIGGHIDSADTRNSHRRRLQRAQHGHHVIHVPVVQLKHPLLTPPGLQGRVLLVLAEERDTEWRRAANGASSIRRAGPQSKHGAAGKRKGETGNPTIAPPRGKARQKQLEQNRACRGAQAHLDDEEEDVMVYVDTLSRRRRSGSQWMANGSAAASPAGASAAAEGTPLPPSSGAAEAWS